MSAPRVKSAYRVSVEDLVDPVRSRAAQLGRMPSQNQIQTEFRVGIDKARAVRTALLDSGFDPTAAQTQTTGSPGTEPSPTTRRLHPVPDTSTSGTTADGEAGGKAGAGGRGDDRADAPATGGAVDNGDSGTAGMSHSAPDPVPPAPADGAASGAPDGPAAEVSGQATTVTEPVPATGTAVATDHASTSSAAEPAATAVAVVRPWWQVVALVLLSLPAFVAIWSGWVGLGRMTGFGDVVLLPGIAEDWEIDSAITLPIGVETYAAFALGVWLSHAPVPAAARRFAKWSAFSALVLGMAGQVAYHLMSAAHVVVAPWLITTAVSCLPVVVLGCGAALAHLLLHTTDTTREERA